MGATQMARELRPTPASCEACADGIAAPFGFSMAFQPIVDLSAGSVFAFEALVRGPGGEGAGTVLSQVTPQNRYAFDQSCRIKAIELAASLGLAQHGANLSINFIPGAMYNPENCIRATLAATRRTAMPRDRLIFELTEDERIVDHNHLRAIFKAYSAHDFRTALDDFGAGYAGLGLLAEFQPNLLKIDMALLRGIDQSRSRQVIVAAMLTACRELGIAVIAEGVETAAEVATLRALGATLFQGYFFARPGFESLPVPAL